MFVHERLIKTVCTFQISIKILLIQEIQVSHKQHKGSRSIAPISLTKQNEWPLRQCDNALN